MNIKLKTTLLIIMIFAIGIVIGAMVNRTLTQKKINDILSRRHPGRFPTVYEKIINPTPEQSRLIRKVLEQHAKRMSKIREDFRKEMHSEFESMKIEMDSILTPEQKKRLEKELPPPVRRFKRFPEKKKPSLRSREDQSPLRKKEKEF